MILDQAEAPSHNALKNKTQVEVVFRQRPDGSVRARTATAAAADLRVTVSGIGVKEPASPSTEASSGQDAIDLMRMNLSEIEASGGQTRPLSEYIGERAQAQRKRAKRRRGTRLSGRSDRQRSSRA